MKGISMILVGTFLLSVLAGCGTIKGIGEDISAVGGWVSKSSEEVQQGNE